MKIKGINSKKTYRISLEEHAGKGEKNHRVKIVNIERIGHKKEGTCRRHLSVWLESKVQEGNNGSELTKHLGDFMCVRGQSSNRISSIY